MYFINKEMSSQVKNFFKEYSTLCGFFFYLDIHVFLGLCISSSPINATKFTFYLEITLLRLEKLLA